MDRETYVSIARAVRAGVPVVLMTVTAGSALGAELLLTGDGHEGTLGSEGLDEAVADDARGALETGFTGIRRYEIDSEDAGAVEVFFRSFLPAPVMYVMGAVSAAEPLCRVGALLGFEVIVVDARRALVSEERFPDAARVIVGWPHEVLEGARIDSRTCICVLTHDPKFDVPALEMALRGPAGYIGVLGGKRTHEHRLVVLRERGVPEAALSRIRAPIGLDIGARRPSEMAVAIAAQIVESGVLRGESPAP